MISATNGIHSFSNSVVLAFLIFKTLRANSITANCIPKQIPKKGNLFNLAYSIAFILPSAPRIPKPPGIKIPLKLLKYLKL